MPDDTPQPGWVYKPGDNPQPAPPAEPDKDAQVEPEQTAAKADANAPQAENIPKSAEKPPAEKPLPVNDEGVTWAASEYIAHHKTPGWYLLFIFGVLACSGGIYFLTKDIISSGVVGFAGLLFAALASKKPRQLSYKVDVAGITIGGRFYPYTQFKFFSIARDGVVGSVNFWPLKRFMPELSIYYPPEQEGQILKIITEHLPHEEHEEHSIDKLLKKLRF
jgi:hypothetical protein